MTGFRTSVYLQLNLVIVNWIFSQIYILFLTNDRQRRHRFFEINPIKKKLCDLSIYSDSLILKFVFLFIVYCSTISLLAWDVSRPITMYGRFCHLFLHEKLADLDFSGNIADLFQAKTLQFMLVHK